MFACQFALPFAMLLSRRAKCSLGMLAIIAALILAGYWANMFWLVMPTFREAGFELAWSDLGTFLGIGGLWMAVFLWHLNASSRDAYRASAGEAVKHG
jgi:hypothetical protein